jgi:hypothetical protein
MVTPCIVIWKWKTKAVEKIWVTLHEVRLTTNNVFFAIFFYRYISISNVRDKFIPKHFNPKMQKHSSAQIWVRFYWLSQEYWRPTILFAIASSIGTPICIDAIASKPMLIEHLISSLEYWLIWI